MDSQAQNRGITPRHVSLTVSSVVLRILVAAVLFAQGCAEGSQGEGPGHRDQPLALTPAEEAKIGREAYQKIINDAPLVTSGPEVERVRRVSQRIAQAVEIEPLQREINLRLSGYSFEWEYNVIRDRQVNAFCLPGGKIGVLTGLLEIVQNDDQLAAVIAHEVAHALAHHASERIARERVVGRGLLSLSYDRTQELEADHIGVFLMTFAGYDPQEAVEFWTEMRGARGKGGHLPEILSDHPSDEHRMERLQAWVAPANAAKKAYDEGRISPVSPHR
jgi:predicted Zn-dependent protease